MVNYNWKSKIATDRNQSKFLIKYGLPVETADMRWIEYESNKWVPVPSELFETGLFNEYNIGPVCWSLGRLLYLMDGVDMPTIIRVGERIFEAVADIKFELNREEGTHDFVSQKYSFGENWDKEPEETWKGKLPNHAIDAAVEMMYFVLMNKKDKPKLEIINN